MADIGEDLIADLLSSTDARIAAIGSRAMQNMVPTEDIYPRVWIQRRSSQRDTNLDGSGGIVQEYWDVECFAAATEENDSGLDTVQDLVAGIKDKWDAYAGSIAQGMFVTDHDDEYLYKGINAVDGVHAAALELEIWRATT